jgi:hypothetical protein
MQIFLLRWIRYINISKKMNIIRCILSREFTIDQTKYIWDHIFCNYSLSNNGSLEFLDFIILAMITRIRDESFYIIKFLLFPNKFNNIVLNK